MESCTTPKSRGSSVPVVGRRAGLAISRCIAPFGLPIPQLAAKFLGLCDAAALVAKYRRNNADVHIYVGDGYGGGVWEKLRENEIPAYRFNGAEGTASRTKDSTLGFANKRAEAYWRLREALNPDQYGGSSIQLPDDPRLRADLTAPRWKLTSRGILIEDKLEIKKRLGRSPDRADAVVMAWADGLTSEAITRFRTGNGNSRHRYEYDPAAEMWGPGAVNNAGQRKRRPLCEPALPTPSSPDRVRPVHG